MSAVIYCDIFAYIKANQISDMTMKKMQLKMIFVTLFAAIFTFAVDVLAAGPVDKGMWLQPAATSSAQRIQDFHDMLFVIITGIVVFVFLLLAFVVVRFNAKANPVPSKVTHHVGLEILWTILPVVILIVIAVPSFKLLYQNDKIAKPDMTLKITGNQWYWHYEYLDHGNIAFDSYMLKDNELKDGQPRLLSVDNPVVLPIDTNIAILVTAGDKDVIHSWAMPQFGIKIDAVPMRTNETWFRIEKAGVYYGQCSEICGKDHAFMPIEIHAVSKEEFEAWVATAKEKFAANDNFAPHEQVIQLTALAQ